MDDEKNYLPWANYKPFYELSKEDFEKIGNNSCFRVRCKLCAPALKTIGTNKTSSSNLRKHLKCVHPQELTKLESFGTGRKKRERYEESEWKHRKLCKIEDFQEAEKDLLCQLADEYQEMIDSSPTDPLLLSKKRKAWESLTIAFNQSGIGVKRTIDQLRQSWENMKVKREKRDDNVQGMPCSISAVYSTPKPDIVIPHLTYTAQNMWDSTMVDSEDHADSENDINQPIVITSLKSEDSNSILEIDCGEQSPSSYNGIQEEREPRSRTEQVRRGHLLLEGKQNEEKIGEQRIRSHNLRIEQELRKQMLKDEMEHRRRMMAMEMSHKKVLNSMEKKIKGEEWSMKKEAILAEERRKEERHKVEMSLLVGTKAEASAVQGRKRDSGSLDSKEEASVLQSAVTEGTPCKASRDESLFQQEIPVSAYDIE